MFGTLFEDDSNMATVTAKPVHLVNGKAIDEPPVERSPQSLVGIKNQGATCYLNSLLQTLFLTPEFREQLFNIGSDELGITGLNKKDGKVRKIPLQLQLLFARLLLLNQSSCKTDDLTDSFGWRNSEEMQQHDVQELSRILFDAIETSLVGTSGDKLIQNLYKGVIVNQIACCSCRRISERDEEFLDLTVSVTGGRSLETALASVFTAEEMMSGKNQYFCEKCKKLVNAKKGAKLKTLPPILTISLLRFNYDLKTFNRYKETGRFTFPVKLNVAKYCNSIHSNGQGDCTAEKTAACTEYSLYSVIIHTGNAHRGHYHAYIRDVDGLGKAQIPIDDPEPEFTADHKKDPITSQPNVMTVNKQQNPNEVTDNIEETLACVIVKYGSVKLDELGQKLRYETGISWKKKYRKKHGSVVKFLLSCPNTFTVDHETNTVSLFTSEGKKDDPTLPMEVEISQKAEAADTVLDISMVRLSLEDNAEENSLNEEPNDQHLETTPDDAMAKEPEKPLEKEEIRHGYSWFDFNDETVKEVCVNEIPNQFEGQQSAYMLFYRRKDLTRPPQSWNNPSYNIPDHILKEIQNENIELEKWRKEYEKASNRLDFYIHTESMCYQSNGLIKSRKPEGHLLHIDRRETVQDLLDKISREMPSFIRKPKQMLPLKSNIEIVQKNKTTIDTLHYLKVLPHGGIHLYECASTKKDVSLYKAGVPSDAHLFAWDGKQILGWEVPFGDENAPTLIHLVCHSHDFTRRASFALPPSHTLDVVKERAAQLLKSVEFEIAPETAEKEKDTSNEEKQDTSTEKQIYEQTYVARMTMLPPETQEDDSQHFTSVQVKIRNEKVHPSLKDAVTVFKVEKSMTVDALKKLVCSSLIIEDDEKYRISMSQDGQIIPLHKDSSIVEMDVPTDHIFILEEGTNLNKDEIVLFIKLFAEYHCSEYVAQSGWNLKQLVDGIQNMFQLPDMEWHLKKCSCYGDPLTVLEPSENALTLKNGDYIAVIPGKLVEKGNIRMKVWLYPTYPSFENRCDKFRLQELLQFGPNVKKLNPNKEINGSSIKSISELTKIGAVSCGHVELKRESTLYDLRRYLNEMISNDLFREDPDFWIRLVERNIPTRLFDKGTTSEDVILKRLKLSSSSQIAIQPSERKLKPNEAVITIVMHIPGTRCYGEEMELVTDVPASKLAYQLSEYLNVPVRHVIVAVKMLDKYEWAVITTDHASESPTKKTNKSVSKKGKKITLKKKLSKSPKESIQIKHGDLIGVKIIPEEDASSFQLYLSDFDTEDDILMRKKLKELREKSQDLHRSQNDSFENEDHFEDTVETSSPVVSTNNEERSLKIHVDNFSQSSDLNVSLS